MQQSSYDKNGEFGDGNQRRNNLVSSGKTITQSFIMYEAHGMRESTRCTALFMSSWLRSVVKYTSWTWIKHEIIAHHKFCPLAKDKNIAGQI